MPNTSANICFISNSSGNVGGAERTFPKFIKSLKECGLNVYVILPSKGPMIKELEEFEIQYKVIPFRTWMNKDSPFYKKILRSLFNIGALIPICIKIKQWKCRIIFSNTLTTSIGALASKFTGNYHIWYIREFGFDDHGRTFDMGNKISNWIIENFSDLYIFNSFEVEKVYDNTLPKSKRKVIYEGYITSEQINNAAFENSNKKLNINDVHCLMIGTIQEGKGHEDAIRAIGELKKRGLNVFLDILGKGFDTAYREKLLQLISQSCLENNIFFHGHVDDPFPIIKSCDIFLMCSKKEAFGIVTIESMQFGKPVIGTQSGGTKELIQDGFNGLFYSPGNFKELSEKIEFLLENPDKLDQLGKNGQGFVFKNFTYSRYIREMCDVFRSILNQ